jgi:hypothetical protein
MRLVVEFGMLLQSACDDLSRTLWGVEKWRKSALK